MEGWHSIFAKSSSEMLGQVLRLCKLFRPLNDRNHRTEVVPVIRTGGASCSLWFRNSTVFTTVFSTVFSVANESLKVDWAPVYFSYIKRVDCTSCRFLAGPGSGKFGFPAAALKKPAFLGKESLIFL